MTRARRTVSSSGKMILAFLKLTFGTLKAAMAADISPPQMKLGRVQNWSEHFWILHAKYSTIIFRRCLHSDPLTEWRKTLLDFNPATFAVRDLNIWSYLPSAQLFWPTFKHHFLSKPELLFHTQFLWSHQAVLVVTPLDFTFLLAHSCKSALSCRKREYFSFIASVLSAVRCRLSSGRGNVWELGHIIEVSVYGR